MTAVFFPSETVGWLKYDGSNKWFKVAVLCKRGNSTFDLRRARTDFTVGPRDILVVVQPTP